MSRLTIVTIFIAVLCNVDPIALITFARSATYLAFLSPHSAIRERKVPASVLGVASVISKHHISQQISSSPLPAPVNHPKPPPFLLLFSKNCTASWPRTLLGDEVDKSCRASCPTLVSIRVSSSGSATKGRVRSRTSRKEGRSGGK